VLAVTKRIDTENHFASESWVHALKKHEGYPRLTAQEDGRWAMHPAPGTRLVYHVLDRLLDLDDGRIALLDEADIDVTVLSLAAPGTEPFEPSLGTKVARATNDELAAAIARHPDRYLGYATLAPKDADAACKELERCVKELGFRGWNTHSNFGDSFLDEKHYWPVLAKAEELGVPVYLHPTWPIVKEFTTYGNALSGPTFGFTAETAMVAMRMIIAGVFDAFPKLQVMLGHYAEGLPFMFDRVDRPYLQGHVRPEPEVAPVLKRMPSEYLRANFLASTSGNYSSAAFACTVAAMGAGRMVIGSDYPFEDMKVCVEFLDAQPMTDAESKQLNWGTAAAIGMDV
jgi:uncharacterized protein